MLPSKTTSTWKEVLAKVIPQVPPNIIVVSRAVDCPPQPDGKNSLLKIMLTYVIKHKSVWCH